MSESSQPPATGPPPGPDYAELRRRLSRAVAAVCPRWLVDRREDIVQAAMIRLFEILERGEGNRELAPSYLRRVAYSVLVDEIRRIRRTREVALEDGVPEQSVVSGSRGPDGQLAALQAGRGIVECLRELVRPRRLAVTLYLQGHSVPAAARLLGWSHKRTENLVYRGLANLRRCLRGKGLEP